MFCFILWLSALAISQSQSTGESSVYTQTRKAAIHQQHVECDEQGGHPSSLLHWITLQEPEQEATGRWRGLPSSHNPAIIHRCLNESSRSVHTLWGQSMLSGHEVGMDSVISEDDRLGEVIITCFGGETSDLIVAEYQSVPLWMILFGLWASFQPLYLGQVALLQAFSIFKPQRLSLKLKSGLFQYRMSQRSSCTEWPTVTEQDITIIAARWSGFAFIIGIIIPTTGVLRFTSRDWHLTATW